MKLIEKRLGQIMAQDLRQYAKHRNDKKLETYPYCGHIYTVHFNAWTFCKEELWASLMYKILSELNEQLDLEASIRKECKVERCMQGIDYVKLNDELETGKKEALKKYLKNGKYHAPKDGRASKALIDILNDGYEQDMADLPKKIHDLQELNRKLKRSQLRHFVSNTLKKTTIERFHSDLKKFRENNQQDNDICDMLDEMDHMRKWSKLLLGGLSESPMKGLIIIILLALSCAIIVLGIYLGPKWAEWKRGFVSAVVVPILGAIGVGTKVVRKARQSLEMYDVPSAIAAADKEMEALQGDIEKGRLQIETKRELETEISAIKNRKWLIEGDSLHDQVKNRLQSSRYEDMLGVVHQAQVSCCV